MTSVPPYFPPPGDPTDRTLETVHLACCGAGDDEDFDLVPPPTDGAVELVGLWPSGVLNEDFEFLFGGRGVGQGARAQQ